MSEELRDKVRDRLENDHPGFLIFGLGMAAFVGSSVIGLPAILAAGLIAAPTLRWYRKRNLKAWEEFDRGNLAPLLNRSEKREFEKANGRLAYQEAVGAPIPPPPQRESIVIRPNVTVSIKTPDMSIASPGLEEEVQPITPPISQAIEQPIKQAEPKSAPNDLAASLAEFPQSTLIVGQPGSGKGVAIAHATRNLKQLHPDIMIWAVDPKCDPSEEWYWEKCDRLLQVPFKPFMDGKEIDSACAKIDLFIKEFEAYEGAKLLIIDEALTLKEKNPIWFKKLMSGFNALCSMGRSRRQYGWVVSQSPNTDDFGVSGGVRNVYRRVLLLHKSNQGLLSNKSTFFSGEPAPLLFEQSDRVFFDSLQNKWSVLPEYWTPKPAQPQYTDIPTPEIAKSFLEWAKTQPDDWQDIMRLWSEWCNNEERQGRSLLSLNGFRLMLKRLNQQLGKGVMEGDRWKRA